MDINYELGDYKFVWDSDKEKINIRKHKLSFKVAARVFLDENAYDDFDKKHSDDEERFKIIGKIDGILAVIYTEREDKNRIISARIAEKEEKEDYYGQFY